MRRARRILIAANRLPVYRAAGEPRWETSPGGLVSALSPVLAQRRGVWFGWHGGGPAPRPFRLDRIDIRPIALSRTDVEGFYHGMANATLWPLYHGALRPPVFRAEWWRRYVEVNRRFARSILRVARPRETVWVHDYHLQLVPEMLRAARPDLRIGFFLHIPFPPVELFEWLPWRKEILRGLLGADIVGFQGPTAAHNFARLARRHVEADWAEGGLEYDKRTVLVGPHPISIDRRWFEAQAGRAVTKRRAQEIRQRVGAERTILLAIDRIDYTKGILERLEALEQLLTRRPQLARRCVLIQIAVPGREGVGDYVTMRRDIEQTVGHINGAFSEPGSVAVHFFCRSLPLAELVSYYLAADVMLVTPLADGMNLVAKEYVACRVDGDGVLVLSEFAGAAAELRRALLVNPRDLEGMATAFETAMSMPARERRRRMASMRSAVARHDVHDWAKGILSEIEG